MATYTDLIARLDILPWSCFVMLKSNGYELRWPSCLRIPNFTFIRLTEVLLSRLLIYWSVLQFYSTVLLSTFKASVMVLYPRPDPKSSYTLFNHGYLGRVSRTCLFDMHYEMVHTPVWIMSNQSNLPQVESSYDQQISQDNESKQDAPGLSSERPRPRVWILN